MCSWFAWGACRDTAAGDYPEDVLSSHSQLAMIWCLRLEVTSEFAVI